MSALSIVATLMASTTAAAAPEKPNPEQPAPTEEPAHCDEFADADEFSEEFKIAEYPDGTSVYGYECVVPDPTSSEIGAAAGGCWNGKSTKNWRSAAGHVLQKSILETHWCGDGINFTHLPHLTRIYGNGYWGWSYTGYGNVNEFYDNVWYSKRYKIEVLQKYEYWDGYKQNRWHRVCHFPAGGFEKC